MVISQMVESLIFAFFTAVYEAWKELFEIEILHHFLRTKIVDSSLSSCILHYYHVQPSC